MGRSRRLLFLITGILLCGVVAATAWNGWGNLLGKHNAMPALENGQSTQPATGESDAVFGTGPILPGDWSSFRGNPHLTGVAESVLPPTLTKLWKYNAGSGIDSTAAIVGDRVYVGTYEGKLLALNLANGKRIWEFAAIDSISAAPCVAGESVYVGDEDGTFYSINAKTGNEQWRFKTKDKIMSSAAVVGGLVVFGSYDYRLLCLDAATGRLKWEVTTDAQVHCAPCVSEDRVIIAGCDARLRALKLQTGEELLNADINNPCGASPAAWDGYVYLGTLNGDCVAMSLSDGTTAWSIPPVDQDDPSRQITASAAVSEDTVVFATQDNRVFNVTRAVGKIRWTFTAKGGIESSPVIAKDRVFFGSSDGDIYGLDLATGKVVWKYPTGGEIKASPAIGGGRLVIGNSDGALYCFGSHP